MNGDVSFTLQENISLASHCTFGIGGPAQFFITVKTIAALQEALTFAHERGLKFFILGKGSNCLFDDRGFKGVVILNKIDFFKGEGPLFEVGAGFSFSHLGVKTARLGYAGLEFACGIPGSVGGAVYMNAGANGGQTQDCLKNVLFVHSNGQISDYRRDELAFAYRQSPFQTMSGAIVAASFELSPSSEARAKQLSIIAYRTQTQPYKDKSAGCVFRNPTVGSAGALIDQLQLKGLQVGGAEVSSQHANFIVNKREAKSSDVLALIAEIKSRVKEEAGAELETEIEVVAYD